MYRRLSRWAWWWRENLRGKEKRAKHTRYFFIAGKPRGEGRKVTKLISIINTEHVSTDGTCPRPLPSTAAPAVTPTAGASPPTTRPAPSSTLFHAPPIPATPSGSSAERCYPARCRLEVTCCRRSSNFKMSHFCSPASVHLPLRRLHRNRRWLWWTRGADRRLYPFHWI